VRKNVRVYNRLQKNVMRSCVNFDRKANVSFTRKQRICVKHPQRTVVWFFLDVQNANLAVSSYAGSAYKSALINESRRSEDRSWCARAAENNAKIIYCGHVLSCAAGRATSGNACASCAASGDRARGAAIRPGRVQAEREINHQMSCGIRGL